MYFKSKNIGSLALLNTHGESYPGGVQGGTALLLYIAFSETFTAWHAWPHKWMDASDMIQILFASNAFGN